MSLPLRQVLLDKFPSVVLGTGRVGSVSDGSPPELRHGLKLAAWRLLVTQLLGVTPPWVNVIPNESLNQLDPRALIML